MRKVIFCVANSLDNFIATKDGGVEWLIDSEEAMEALSEFWKDVDTVVMGRKTYEAAERLSEDNVEFPAEKTYVCSKTRTGSPYPKIEFINEDAVTLLGNLKSQEGKDICFLGGGETAKPVFEAGLIDEMMMNTHPILLGEGVPLFHEYKEPINLELLECKQAPHGCVFLFYKVKHG